MTITIAALASGTGSNVAALLRNIDEGRLDARIGMVLSNNPDAPVLQLARDAGIATWAQNHKDFSSREDFDRAMLDALADVAVDAVILAGYMRILSPLFIRVFTGRILNIHPALLPAFPGAHGVRDALMQGVKVTGCTVHLVDEELDHGPAVIQAVVPIRNGDTVETLLPRIQAMEHRIYPQAVQWLAENRLKVEGNGVMLLPDAYQRSVPTGQSPLGPWLVNPPLEKF